MSKSCEGLLHRKYKEVLTENKERLKRCIRNSVFHNQVGLHVDFSNSSVVVRFTDYFFGQDTFLKGSRFSRSPNKSKIERFYPRMKDIARDLGYEFVVGDLSEPPLSMEYLRMKITFRLTTGFLAKMGLKEEEMTVEDLIEYLRNLWYKIKDRLSIRGYRL